MALTDHLPTPKTRTTIVHRALDQLTDTDQATFYAWLDDVDISYPRIAAALTAQTGVRVTDGNVADYARRTGRSRR